MRLLFLLGCLFFFSSHSLAQYPSSSMTLSFEWGNLPACTKEAQRTVPNPTFTLGNVPRNTASLFFKLVDENKPTSKHGGGEARYVGTNTIPSGSFTYQRPCPPNGSHIYTWTVFALDQNRVILGTAASSLSYP